MEPRIVTVVIFINNTVVELKLKVTPQVEKNPT